MQSRGLLTFRAVVAGLLGLLFLGAGVLSHGALLPAALRSRPSLHIVTALFGAGWLVQALFLERQRRVGELIGRFAKRSRASPGARYTESCTPSTAKLNN